MREHRFHDTGEAYDATQWNEAIHNGDVLIIEAEKVVGIADTWPIAVTIPANNLHSVVDRKALEDYIDAPHRGADKITREHVRNAVAVAQRLGFTVNPIFEGV